MFSDQNDSNEKWVFFTAELQIQNKSHDGMLNTPRSSQQQVLMHTDAAEPPTVKLGLMVSG